MDFPGPNSESWREVELAFLIECVAQGGFLMITNTGRNIAQVRHLEEPNGFAPLIVTFTNTSSSDYDTSACESGDGLTSTSESLTHTY